MVFYHNYVCWVWKYVFFFKCENRMKETIINLSSKVFFGINKACEVWKIVLATKKTALTVGQNGDQYGRQPNIKIFFKIGQPSDSQNNTLSYITYAETRKKRCYISIFINDLAVNIKKTNIWIPINDGKVSFTFSDDTVKLTKNENNIQVSLDLFYNWCWSEKSNVLYFRRDRQPCS